jgi:threonine/homoserine/homoserine lactone efflux protein
MTIITALFFGFISAVIGILPPGLINMTAAKVDIKEGKRAALWFVIGAVIVIFFQVYLAILFAQFIGERPQVVVLLREIGCGIFTLLTIYFLVIAKVPQKKEGDIKKQRISTRFFLGMLLSALNFFPIPYYVVVSLSLASYGWFVFETFSIFIFVLGAVLGSFLVFYSYISFFSKIENKTDFFMRNMNKIIGSITGMIALITLFNIVKYYLK